MSTIKNWQEKYFHKINPLETEILIARANGKTREFVLTHPEYELKEKEEKKIKNYFERRRLQEPIAYITGHKEFYGLDLKVNKHTLIPRPETELIVDEVLKELKRQKKHGRANVVIDIGTGSGNIAIALAKNLFSEKNKISFLATDISEKALSVARQNAKDKKLGKNIRFLHSDLLRIFLDNPSLWRTMFQKKSLFIVANLPYLSRKNYLSAMKDVRVYEPKNALLSGRDGLSHYRKLFRQLKKFQQIFSLFELFCFLEISPEQKKNLSLLAKKIFPEAKTEFKKDLTRKWRVFFLKF